ncbi:asparaginase [Cohnella faecalis]|uniref:Asparaginase n=1 Tax=Cohnella faecalis TaxID=2315694 RepID=A0A398CHE5_9BACL|nr:asparaginase [Cohnella faecalis]RIE02626.1 asparaginase [Cohnella faecalis]
MTERLATAGDVPLVLTIRGGLPENVHRGRICVVSADNRKIVEAYGDADAAAFIRSAGKPLQAIGPLLGGVAEAYDWEDRHLAMLAASHRGFPAQVEALDEMRKKAGIPEEAFAFRAGAPINAKSRDEWARDGESPRKLYHTCAGKHLGMLAWSKLSGWPLEGYTRIDHPAQKQVVRHIRSWTNTDENDSAFGRDGCGLPAAAVPLRSIALAYARLACLDTAPAAASTEAAGRVAQAMNRHPELVEGQGRLASLLLADPNIVAKSGAQGLFAIGLRRERLGIAIHVSDGSEMPWALIAIALLKRLGGVSAQTMASLEARYPSEYVNDTGDVAGHKETLF